MKAHASLPWWNGHGYVLKRNGWLARCSLWPMKTLPVPPSVSARWRRGHGPRGWRGQGGVCHVPAAGDAACNTSPRCVGERHMADGHGVQHPRLAPASLFGHPRPNDKVACVSARPRALPAGSCCYSSYARLHSHAVPPGVISSLTITGTSVSKAAMVDLDQRSASSEIVRIIRPLPVASAWSVCK